jgi:amidase
MISAFASATEMLDALRRRQISSTELLNLHLDRIRRYNPELNAIVTLDDVRAREAAMIADRTRAAGEEAPLLGLPLTIKDAIDIAGLPTTGGLRRRAGWVAASDAPVVARIRAAGGVIMGKTNTPPYAGDWQTANRLFGRSNNPWDLARTPGGSTGGGAAAVAAGLSPLEIGSDIGGSIRVPAAFCGVCGHRPSETALPRSGHFPGSPLPNPASILNVLGPLARGAVDLELALEVVAGPEAGEDVAWRISIPPARHSRLSDFRVAVLPWLDWLPVDGEIVTAVESLSESLRRAGARVEWTQPEAFGDFKDYHLLYQVLLVAMFSFSAGQETEDRGRKAEDSIMGDAELAPHAQRLLGSAHELLKAFAQRERYRSAYRSFFRDWDVLLSPVAIVPAFPHDDRPEAERSFLIGGQTVPYHRLNVYPGIATLCGQPSTAFPVGRTRNGLPIGLQAVGPYLEDRTPISFARLVAQEVGGFEPPQGSISSRLSSP